MSGLSKIRKQGGAAIITIPPALLKQLNLDVGAEVALSVERGRLIAQPAKPARRRYSMADLLKGSAEMKMLTAEVAWAEEGGAVGHEIA